MKATSLVTAFGHPSFGHGSEQRNPHKIRALMGAAPELFSKSPEIEAIEILGAKLPGLTR